MTHGPRRLVPLLTATALVALASPAAPQTTTPEPTHPADVEGTAIERALESRTKGGQDASVVVFEIADFQCPYCAQFSATVGPEIDARYVETGRVQWVFVNLPLQNHPFAWHAAEAALCAGAAGDRFWAMHDRLFAEQDQWGSATDPAERFAQYAADLGVPADAFAACIRDDDVAPLILQDFASAVSAGINGTPTFIIMKDQEVVEQLVGIQPMEEWARVLDSAIER